MCFPCGPLQCDTGHVWQAKLKAGAVYGSLMWKGLEWSVLQPGVRCVCVFVSTKCTLHMSFLFLPLLSYFRSLIRTYNWSLSSPHINTAVKHGWSSLRGLCAPRMWWPNGVPWSLADLGLKNSISHERAIDLPIYECGNPSSEMLNSELRASKWQSQNSMPGLLTMKLMLLTAVFLLIFCLSIGKSNVLGLQFLILRMKRAKLALQSYYKGERR